MFDAAGLTHAKLLSVEPAGLDAALDGAVKNSDVLVVLGGDGTISSAAAKCAAAGRLLIPLPGGTMNMLPKALYGDRTWPVALADTLSDPKVHVVSGGKVPMTVRSSAPRSWAHLPSGRKREKLAERAMWSKPLSERSRRLDDPLLSHSTTTSAVA